MEREGRGAFRATSRIKPRASTIGDRMRGGGPAPIGAPPSPTGAAGGARFRCVARRDAGRQRARRILRTATRWGRTARSSVAGRTACSGGAANERNGRSSDLAPEWGSMICRRSGDVVCPPNYAHEPDHTSHLAHKTTLFTFTDVTSSTEHLNARLQRIRTLLHRLARVRDTAIEAELITQLTLETESVRTLRANAGDATSESASTSSAQPAGRPRVAGAGHRVRAGRRVARPD
jgi:hypothetical protein